MLVPLTNVTLGVGTFLAARLGAAAANFCKDVRVVDGAIQACAVLYGGKMEVTVALERAPAVLGIWPGARPGEQGWAATAPPVEQVAVSLPDAPRVMFKRYIDPDAGDVDISQQESLVAVGRGIQNKDNLELAAELAEELGGAVCGSRPVIDQGGCRFPGRWASRARTSRPSFTLRRASAARRSMSKGSGTRVW